MQLDPEQYQACVERLPIYREALRREEEELAHLPPAQVEQITADTRHMIAHLEKCIADYDAAHLAPA
jgi:hypothetical protein